VNKYREAFRKWQRTYLERELRRAGGAVSQMAARNGLNRQHAYKLLEKAGVRVKERAYRPPREGNAAWRALSDRPPSSNHCA
jgi:DNA-binding NtrC family response regulator